MEYFSVKELAARRLPGLGDKTPDEASRIRLINNRAKREDWRDRVSTNGEPLAKREGQGGGWKYHVSLLPVPAQKALTTNTSSEAVTAKKALARSVEWQRYEAASVKQKEAARKKLAALEAVDVLARAGTKRDVAVSLIAADHKVANASIYNWFTLVAGVERSDWLAYLVPKHVGRVATVLCDPRVWDFLKSDYLRDAAPRFQVCYRRAEGLAKELGAKIPSARTLQRRLDAEVPQAVQVLAREGLDAVKRLYPAQERDKSVYHALEAVNADGHKFDVFASYPDGSIGRPLLIGWQDIYSAKILSWRLDRSETAEAVRLSFGDLVEHYGIPDHCYLDNGRAFAAKWLTGGTPNRYRFKVKTEDPVGILTALGVEVHWTTPYAGQSKPIERAWRDLCDSIAKHPICAGAYTGNQPNAKPESYGSRAVPIAEFEALVADGIREHNARVGRRSKIANGRSLDETFKESYEKSPIRLATAEQRRLWLLAAEGLKADKTDGSLRLMGNRYWAEFLTQHRGRSLIARFDPQALLNPLEIYRLDGSYLGPVEVIEAAGFNDVTAAKAHAKARGDFLKSQKAMLAAERKLSPSEVADLLPKLPAPDRPVPRIARPIFGGATAATAVDLDPQQSTEHDEFFEDFTEGVKRLRLVE